ncbi:MAG: hypothetical protein V3V08_16280 [Nannocystaceae bacterium]
MKPKLEAFVERFVLPLLNGAAVEVHGRPFSRSDGAALLADASALGSAELRWARRDRARRLVADPQLPDPSAEEFCLWLGLHNMLLFDHPDRGRIWARDAKWQRVELETRALLGFPDSTAVEASLVRHVAVGRLRDLTREDHVVTAGNAEKRYAGRAAPRRALAAGPGIRWRTETVRWLDQNHDPVVLRLLPEAFRASPLTCLLYPELAPPQWSPLHAAGFLGRRSYARAVCHHWARHTNWVLAGGIVLGSLLRSLGIWGGATPLGDSEPAMDSAHPLALPGVAFADGPEQVGAIVGALVHLHLLKVLELDARVVASSGTADGSVLAFLALPLLLHALEPALGHPLAGLEERAGGEIRRRWEEYQNHLSGIVPRSAREALLVTLVPRIVKKT